MESTVHCPVRYLYYLATAASAFGGIWAVIPFGWQHVPAEQKRLVLLVVPIMGSMVLLGYLPELRIYNELVPVLTGPAFAARLGLLREQHPRQTRAGKP